MICSKIETSQAKPSAWEAIQSVLGHVVEKCDSVCFEIEVRMNSFAAVLSTLSYLSMYSISYLLPIRKYNFDM